MRDVFYSEVGEPNWGLRLDLSHMEQVFSPSPVHSLISDVILLTLEHVIWSWDVAHTSACQPAADCGAVCHSAGVWCTRAAAWGAGRCQPPPPLSPQQSRASAADGSHPGLKEGDLERTLQTRQFRISRLAFFFFYLEEIACERAIFPPSKLIHFWSGGDVTSFIFYHLSLCWSQNSDILCGHQLLGL